MHSCRTPVHYCVIFQESEHNHKTQHLLQKSSAASIFAFCGRVTEHCISYALYLWRERVLSVELCGLQTDLKSSLTAQVRISVACMCVTPQAELSHLPSACAFLCLVNSNLLGKVIKTRWKQMKLW